jgi:restriction endonuclease Mrr
MAADTLRVSLGFSWNVVMRVTPEELRSGAIVLPEPWMVRHLMDHPEAMRDLSTWDFQVYIAALIEQKWGHKVQLGPRGADGGVDVRAERQGEFGLELMLVQCKHPQPGKPVGVDTVRILHHQVLKQEATRGLVVTDSTFTRNALREIQACRYQMDGADGERIRQWLEALRTGAPGADPPPLP